ncbi:hypothetical protein [Magnetococcus sp. PR-3]|uniref:hypothetical protein n=1 Tax=Magnetococcus sp. PR-3 TaxID=3120355 RepID=UPI002FCE486A
MSFTLTWENLSYMVVILTALQALASWVLSALFVKQADCSKRREGCHLAIADVAQETEASLKQGEMKFLTLESEHKQIFSGMNAVRDELGELKSDLKERMDRMEKMLIEHVVQG